MLTSRNGPARKLVVNYLNHKMAEEEVGIMIFLLNSNKN